MSDDTEMTFTGTTDGVDGTENTPVHVLEIENVPEEVEVEASVKASEEAPEIEASEVETSEVEVSTDAPVGVKKLTFLGKPIKPRVEEARKEEEEMKTLLKSAIFQIEEELLAKYTAPDEDGNSPSEEEEAMSQQNAEHIRKLMEHFISPIILSILSNTTQLKLQTKNLKIQTLHNQESAELQNSNSSELQNAKKKTSWSIYLSDIAKNLPGWKEATSKLTFASAEYKKLTKQEKDQIVLEYFSSRNLPYPGKTHTPQKVARISGLDAFRKYWYEERKKTNPEAKGLDSLRCTAEWKALSPEQQNEWKELRRQQVEGV